MASTVKRVPIPRRGVDYRGKVVLAPMVRSGELPTRLVALQYGADLVWGPETIDRAMIGTTRRVDPDTGIIEWVKHPSQDHKVPPPSAKENVIFRVHPTREAGRLIFQIGTSDPDRAVAAARLFAADVAGIDVNAGCPKPFSTHDGMGAELLKTPDKLCAILRGLVSAIVPEFEVGISVKIRLLETAAQTEDLVRRLCGTGITALTVHCRTAPMRPREPAIRGQLRMIAGLCREAGVACLVNGDVEDRDHAARLVGEFGVDGAMIARGAESNPSCFRGQADGGLLPWRTVVEEYLKAAIEVRNRFANTKHMLLQFIPGKERLTADIHRARTYHAVCEALGLDSLLETARQVDVRLSIDEDSVELAKKAKSERKKANQSALAAGGNMAQGRKAVHKTQNSLSDRGVAMAPDPKSVPAALPA